MSTEENKKVVLRWIEQAWEKKNVDVIDELHALDYVGHIVGTPGPVRGREAFKQLFTTYLAAFDLQRTNEFLIAEGDRWWPTTPTASSTKVSSPVSRRRGRS
ncbi:MAG TPA: ester cyclase [Actinomycetota bacterium]|nr:ester cyclase [Actinomycetota bacterium]